MKYDPDSTYSILVKHAGAIDSPMERHCFEVAIKGGCEEYRFIGTLGFGGKYRPKRNEVDCYPEDRNPKRDAAIKATNAALRGDPA